MKAVLISIRPKWCALIASGQKTIEVRKTKPKLETPFKCYIYCTKPSKSKQTICGCFVLNSDELFRHPRQGIKYGDSIELMAEDNYTKDNFLNGKIIGEFICRNIRPVVAGYIHGACLTYDEVTNYLGRNGRGWGLEISDLVIYDKPKKLSEFHYCGACEYGLFCNDDKTCKKKMQRPPQSWCYVEELKWTK